MPEPKSQLRIGWWNVRSLGCWKRIARRKKCRNASGGGIDEGEFQLSAGTMDGNDVARRVLPRPLSRRKNRRSLVTG